MSVDIDQAQEAATAANQRHNQSSIRSDGVAVPPDHPISKTWHAQKRKTLLVVDNDLPTISATLEALSTEYRLLRATGPGMALIKLIFYHVDAAIIDVHLRSDNDDTDLSGITFSKLLYSFLPVILSSKAKNLDAVGANAGAQRAMSGLIKSKEVHYIPKGMDTDFLLMRVRQVLNASPDRAYRFALIRAALRQIWPALAVLLLFILTIFCGLAATASQDLSLLGWAALLLIPTVPLLKDGRAIVDGKWRTIARHLKNYMPAILLLLCAASTIRLIVDNDTFWISISAVLLVAAIIFAGFADDSLDPPLKNHWQQNLDTSTWLVHFLLISKIALMLGFGLAIAVTMTGNLRLLTFAALMAIYYVLCVGLSAGNLSSIKRRDTLKS